jgi:predicted DNA-binding antitoxin AbrB/MazE fold protein
MTIHVHATYRAGVIHPDEPLGLPENTEVDVVVVPVFDTAPTAPQTEDDLDAIRPKSPKMTSQEFRELIAKHAVRVGSLPPDFSREDIYSDHD